MDKFALRVHVDVKKNDESWFEEIQISHHLDKPQLVEMEKDLLAIKNKWAKDSGIR
jgi:hypothetical protein